MDIKKTDRDLLVEHFGPATPVLVVQGIGLSPDWFSVARLGDLTESLIAERTSNYESHDAAIGLVIAAPFGMNLPGRLIEIIRITGSGAAFIQLGLAAFSRARTEVGPDATDAADAARHQDLISELVFKPVS